MGSFVHITSTTTTRYMARTLVCVCVCVLISINPFVDRRKIARSSCCYCFSPAIDRTNVWSQPTANWIRSHQGSHNHLVGRYVEYKSDHVSSVLERYRLSGCYRHHKWYSQLLQLHSSVKPFVQHRRTPRDGTSRRHSWHSCPLE